MGRLQRADTIAMLYNMREADDIPIQLIERFRIWPFFISAEYLADALTCCQNNVPGQGGGVGGLPPETFVAKAAAAQQLEAGRRQQHRLSASWTGTHELEDLWKATAASACNCL